jgi:hypothetical protein
VQARGRPNATDPDKFGKALRWSWDRYKAGKGL